MLQRFVSLSIVAGLACAVAGCDVDTTADVDGTLRADGFALFAVENDRAQRNDVTVTIDDVDPGATYVLLYSPTAPRNVGWFLFDPSTRSTCNSDLVGACEVAGYGYVVDVVTAPDDAKRITLSDERCGCDGSRKSHWTGHWAVMRIERTSRTNRLRFDVHARESDDGGFAKAPDVDQLQ